MGKSKNQKTKLAKIRKLQGQLHLLSERCAETLAMDPEHYPMQSELESFTCKVNEARQSCQDGVMPDISFLQDYQLEKDTQDVRDAAWARQHARKGVFRRMFS